MRCLRAAARRAGPAPHCSPRRGKRSGLKPKTMARPRAKLEPAELKAALERGILDRGDDDAERVAGLGAAPCVHRLPAPVRTY